jgi:hypothetical protein
MFGGDGGGWSFRVGEEHCELVADAFAEVISRWVELLSDVFSGVFSGVFSDVFCDVFSV